MYRMSLVVACLFVSRAFGAPQITAAAGAAVQGATITITGSGFGLKSAAAPLYYSNFDSYSAGNSAVNTGLDALNGDLGALTPYVDSSKSVSGANSLRMDYPLNKNGFFPEVGLGGVNTTEVYVSAWIYWERTAGPGGVVPVFKLVRAEANPPYHGIPGFYDTIRPDDTGAIVAVDRASVSSTGVATYDDTRNAEPTSGSWHRIEYYFKLSTPGVADGTYQTWVDGVLDADIVNVMSRAPGNLSTINNVISPIDGISSYGLSNSYSLWVDNLYIDVTRARVELGDASTFSACKIRYIQPAIAWSNGLISITVEANTFAPGTKAYLYVLDANGVANSQGYPIVIAAGTVPRAPVFTQNQ